MLTSLRETYCKITQYELNHNENTIFPFIINKFLQDCVVTVDGFKMNDAVGTSSCCGSADKLFLNPTVDVLSAITHGSWNLREENRILIYMNVFNHFFNAGRAIQGARDTI